jgi:hypothetical protein
VNFGEDEADFLPFHYPYNRFIKPALNLTRPEHRRDKMTRETFFSVLTIHYYTCPGIKTPEKAGSMDVGFIIWSMGE